ncbi:23.6 kDa heat shock protein, mitochondrial [Lolium rigidum]|uniref:23.6 kDa heat shock protein, mitochondrial n=1 Tax=Lolium rigidum TaxID=89674 RepID=UPI001F5C2B56|nr:23.6 kDa heat shock protein, mitochondrial [Lolium rigidum]
MAVVRLCFSKALAGRAPALVRPAAASSHGGLNLRSLFSSEAADGTGKTSHHEVAVADRSGPNTASHWPWRDLRVRDLVPFRLVDGLGSALSHVAETLSRPLERLRPLLGKVREDEEVYRLRFEVPGLGKDDVRVTVEDGALVIRGEKTVRDEGGGDGGEWWSASSYGCYHASLLLPEDARVDGITAEVKDGVLYVSVPRVPGRERNVTEVEVR